MSGPRVDWRPAPPVITSPANPRVRAALGLRERRARDREGRLLVDGLREVARAVEAGARVIEAFVTDPPPGGEEGRALVAALRVAGAEVVIVSPAVQARLAYGERTNGLVAVVATPGRSLDVLALPPDALVAVLEGVEKPGNLGAIVRSADGAGLAAVVATGPGADPWNPNAIRASQGAVFSLAVVAASTDETLAWLRGRACGSWRPGSTAPCRTRRSICAARSLSSWGRRQPG